MIIQNLILTIDLGTAGPKVCVFDSQANIVDKAFEETSLNLIEDGGAEQNPDDWKNAILNAFATLKTRAKFNPKNIKAINITSQWSGTVAVDKNGEAIHDAIIWMDSRGAPYVQKIMDGWPKIEGYGLFKVLEWIRKTGGAPTKSGKDSIAHILFLKNEKADVYEKTYKFLEPKDYLNNWLSGKILSSYESITLHWVTDNRDVNNIKYDDKLLKWAGLEKEKLPDLISPNSIVGPLKKDIIDLLGVADDCQLISGSPDTHSAAVGSGAVGENEPHLYIGTSSWLLAHTTKKKTDIFHNMGTIPSSLKGKYLLANEQECAGVNLQFLRDQLFFPKDALNDKEAPSDFYEKLDTMAESIAPGCDGLYFLPWMYGERSPIDDHYARGGFYNMSLKHSRAHIARAVLEGVAFNSRWLLKYVEKNTNTTAKEIRFIGGGANSTTWCQILADVLNRPILQMDDPIQANSRGSAILASLALGWISEKDISTLCKVKKIYQPSKNSAELYNDLFDTFVTIYERNKNIYQYLNKKLH